MTLLQARLIDSTHLELAEPVDLPAGRKLLVSVVETDDEHDEHQQWLASSEATLRTAYSDAEPDYSLDLIKEPNPEYRR